MKQIPLSQGYFALVDDKDYEELMKWKWFLWSNRCNARYAIRNRSGRNKGTARMHRHIMDAPKDMQVDHINHDGLDNRRCNLRLCTHAGNMQNRRPQASCSQYKGVHLHGKKWAARITDGGRFVWLGAYPSQEEAARVYDKKAREFFGEFACCNFPK